MDQQAWIDKLAIQELIFRYSDSVNRGDMSATESVCAPDVIWESPRFGMRFESAREVCDFLARNNVGQELLIQTPHCPLITLTGPDSARATTTVHEFCRGSVVQEGHAFGPVGTEINFQDYAIYYDEVERIDGTWLFTHRIFVPIYMEPGVVIGEVPTPRSALIAPDAK